MTPAIVLATVAVGAGAAVLRYLVSLAFARPSRPGGRVDFPWAVLVVNVVGSVIGGAVLGLAASGGVDAGIQLILLTGLCGGLTTFSTLGVETVQLVVAGRWRAALVSVAANLAAGTGSAVGAYALFVYVLVIA
ncbi:MAG: CrcB family protein [Rhodoglobus sp.]